MNSRIERKYHWYMLCVCLILALCHAENLIVYIQRIIFLRKKKHIFPQVVYRLVYTIQYASCTILMLDTTVQCQRLEIDLD